jgi:phosphoribulokinase
VSRSIVLGLVGDSGTGKTTLTRGLVRVLGEEHVSHLSGDDYHRYDRARRAQLGVTPLDPAANHLDILAQHLTHLRRWEPVLKPVYDHGRGTFAPAVYVRPARFLIAEGLLNFHTETLRSAHEIRAFLAPQEELHRAWKVKRDCARRGYTTSEALAEIDRRQDDARAYIQPQREAADIVVAFRADGGRGPAHLDVDVVLRDTLPHPDLSPLIDGRPGGPTLLEREHEQLVRIPGDLDPEHAAALEESIWERISFANHLRIRRLGEFTVGTDLRRSDSLALVQLILLYHLVRARATINTGDEPPGAVPRGGTGADSALHH